jgi:hypothetical protein
MRDRVRELFLSAHWYTRLWVTHQEHKKSAGFTRRRRISAEIFVREMDLSHIDHSGSRHLAVSDGRLSDSDFRITPDAWNAAIDGR